MLLTCFYCLDFNVFTIHPPRGPFILQLGEVPPTPVIRSPEAYAVIWTNRPGPPRTSVDLDLPYLLSNLEERPVQVLLFQILVSISFQSSNVLVDRNLI